MYEIKIPQLGVNDEFATIVEWHVKDKDKVKSGDVICTIETSKAIHDITADKSGYIKIKVEKGEEVRIQETIGLIVDSLNINIDKYVARTGRKKEHEIELREHEVEKDIKSLMDSRARKTRATRKAEELAKELGVDLELIPYKGIIREKDVRKYAELESK